MQLIPTPQTIKFEKETDYKGQYIIQPLYPGYGITIGNALRRVLISSMPGAAITSVKIEGVEHEFSSIDYVKEDVVDILLNLKQLNLSIEGEVSADEPLKITLSKTGEGKVTAKDFQCPSQIKIANPDLHIATLTDKAAKLEMECYVSSGMGYLPTENRDVKLDIGHIAIDAIFTPINQVSVETEHVRVGEMTNWDKLILSIETNGTITCQQAFNLAVNILRQQFDSLVGVQEKSATEVKEEEVETPKTTIEEENASENVAAADSGEEAEIAEDNDKTEEKKKRGRPKKDK